MSEHIFKKFKEGLPINANSKEEKEALEALLNKPNMVATEKDLKEIEDPIELEKNWWKDAEPYRDIQQVQNDIEKGILEKIESDHNLKLIMRLENPEFSDWLPYLHKKTAELLKEVGMRWRKQMRSENLSEDIALAVTNLLITKEYQQKAIKNGKLAAEGGSHSKGRSFDIDGCGYYLDGRQVNPRQTENYAELYKPRVHLILSQILEKMKSEGLLNFIREFPNTDNQSFHITRKP